MFLLTADPRQVTALLPSNAACLVVVVFVSVFLRSHKSLESVDPQFTMRRKMEQLREELELMEQLRDVRHIIHPTNVITHSTASCTHTRLSDCRRLRRASRAD